MDNSMFIAKRDEYLKKYFECINKAAEDFKAGRAFDCQALQALGDVIRIFGHLDKQYNSKVEEGMNY